MSSSLAHINSISYVYWKISTSLSSFLQIRDERPKSGMNCSNPDMASQLGDEQAIANIHFRYRIWNCAQ